METLLRPRKTRKSRFFLVFILASLLAHALLFWWAYSGRLPGKGPSGSGVEERFRAMVSAATDLDGAERARLEKRLAEVKAGDWKRETAAATLGKLAGQAGVPLLGARVVRSLDPERSKEGRWDIELRLRWGEGERPARDILTLAFLVGETTLRSRFGSHRLWLVLETPDDVARAVLETIDCRLYRNGKLSGVDLLHKAKLAMEPEP